MLSGHDELYLVVHPASQLAHKLALILHNKSDMKINRTKTHHIFQSSLILHFLLFQLQMSGAPWTVGDPRTDPVWDPGSGSGRKQGSYLLVGVFFTVLG